MSGIIDTVGSKSGIVGSDVYPAGHILAMYNVDSYAQTSIAAGGNATVLTKTFNRVKGNSHFICQANIHAAPLTSNSNLDGVDPIYSFVINGSLHDTNPLSYTSWDDGYYKSSVPAWRQDGSSYVGTYDVYSHYVSVDMTHISSGSDNDSVTIAVRVKANYASGIGIYVNRSQASQNTGSLSSLTIYEIAS